MSSIIVNLTPRPLTVMLSKRRSANMDRYAKAGPYPEDPDQLIKESPHLKECMTARPKMCAVKAAAGSKKPKLAPKETPPPGPGKQDKGNQPRQSRRGSRRGRKDTK